MSGSISHWQIPQFWPDLGRGNPPVVAPVVGHQEGRHGGENPTRNFGPIWVGAIPPWLPRLWATKRVGTGARTLPEILARFG
ncbi:hypothetical protein PROH_00205 [Prochlorothrix hollandica PCC 9006 = CALU 1027]|uniref:Uncharacterized protein n=1 Tax=Prochlorothrix hollandica PCC 9006 = CALU 1027 TaxID=317619 RepID=A0A0M2Q2U4_PROHO|nr:hypothetical protein PROH_00205 [Prochlorothrix hollandica PCC 9006 = CALU 1027]